MFGIRLSILRCQAGLTQAQLGARLNLTASALGMYERGCRMPSLSIVARIADEFGVSCDFLLSGRGQNEREAALEWMVLLFSSLGQQQEDGTKRAGGCTMKRVINQTLCAAGMDGIF